MRHQAADATALKMKGGEQCTDPVIATMAGVILALIVGVVGLSAQADDQGAVDSLKVNSLKVNSL